VTEKSLRNLEIFTYFLEVYNTLKIVGAEFEHAIGNCQFVLLQGQIGYSSLFAGALYFEISHFQRFVLK
jgi:hypothetical protein